MNSKASIMDNPCAALTGSSVLESRMMLSLMSGVGSTSVMKMVRPFHFEEIKVTLKHW